MNGATDPTSIDTFAPLPIPLRQTLSGLPQQGQRENKTGASRADSKWTAGKTPHLCIISHGCYKNDGQGRVTYEIVKACLRQGWQVTFIGSILADEIQNEPSIRWIKVTRSRLPTNLLKNIIFAVLATNAFEKCKANFDVVHSNGFIIWSASDVNTAHFVHSGWKSSRFYPFRPLKSPYSFYQFFYTSLNSRLEKHAFRASRRVIAVSAKVMDEIASLKVANKEEISIIHNGVDLEEFYPGEAQRGRFSLPENLPMFLFAGDIRSPRKNLESVLEALTLVPEAHLVVAGALQGSPYPKLTEKLGIGNRVHFLGMTKDMPDLMRSVDAFVFPSRYEACSLVIFEALASGLPVLTAETAGGSEVIGDAGMVVVDPDDIQEIARLMTTLARDTALRFSMAHKARQIAADLSWIHMTERYLKVYNDILNEKTAAHALSNTTREMGIEP